MSNIQNFLSVEEEQEVVEAIRMAEKQTSGEIRVHIERVLPGDVLTRATEVFHMLKMDNTKLQNGVLVYLAVDDKKFAIIGDKGINEKVAENFWNATKDSMTAQFKDGNFKQGLINGITMAGAELKHYFPCEDDDQDELTNEISNG